SSGRGLTRLFSVLFLSDSSGTLYSRRPSSRTKENYGILRQIEEAQIVNPFLWHVSLYGVHQTAGSLACILFKLLAESRTFQDVTIDHAVRHLAPANCDCAFTINAAHIAE